MRRRYLRLSRCLALAASWLLLGSMFAATTTAAPTSSHTAKSAVYVRSNTTPITINTTGAAAPYPSVISVSNVPNALEEVRVQLVGFSHSYPDDVDIVLRGPGGQLAMLISDAGGALDVSNQTLLFDQASSNLLPDEVEAAITNGTYRPANYASGMDVIDTFTGGPGTLNNQAANLGAFVGTNPSGNWELFEIDDAAEDGGQIAGGWFLFLTATSYVVNASDDVTDVQGCNTSHCSLREAINVAAANSTIDIASTVRRISLTNGQLAITKSLVIRGNGAEKTAISGNFNSRVFEVSGAATVLDLRALSVTEGLTSGSGGGILLTSGSVLMNQCGVHGNRAELFGGGIVS